MWLNMAFLNSVVMGNSIKNYLLFITILLIGLLFKKICSRFLGTLSFKIFGGFGTGSNATVFVTLLLKPIELLITCLISYLAINQLNYPLNEVIFSRQRIANKVISYYEITAINIIDKIFVFLFILSTFWLLLRILDFTAHVFMHKATRNESKIGEQMVPFIHELGKIIIIIIGVFIIIGTVFELNITTLVAGLGVGSLAIGLGARSIFENLFGTFTIFADKPFIVGDNVRIDKYEGTIEKVGFRSTLLRTIDKTLVVIPNSKMSNDLLENLTLRNLRRVKFNVGLQYDTAAATMLSISKDIEAYINKHAVTNNESLVHFDSFGDSALNLQVLYYIEVIDYIQYSHIREEINYQIMNIVALHNASFAFPSQTVYYKELDKPPTLE